MDDLPQRFDFEDTTPRTFVVTEADGGARLDAFLVPRLEAFSRSAVQRFIRAGSVRLNDAPARPAVKVRPGDRVDVDVPALLEPTAEPEDLPLAVLWEDDALVAIDKAPGMAVHPGRGRWTGTVANAIAFRYWPRRSDEGAEAGGAVGEAHRPGIVHRLDLETSGLLLVAKTEAAQAALSLAFQERTVEKVYRALVFGEPAFDEDEIDLPLGRDVHDPLKMAVRFDVGRAAVTRTRTLERFGIAAQVECYPHTGRTHQIRVHLRERGHPLLGDSIYARGRTPPVPVPRLMLHAFRIAFPHPVSGARVEIEAPLPADFVAVRDALIDAGGGGG